MRCPRAKTAAADATGTVTEGEDTAWDIVGSVDAWHAVLAGRANLGVAMRRCELRYCETGEAEPAAADLRIGMLAELLGIAPSWQAAAQLADRAPATVGS